MRRKGYTKKVLEAQILVYEKAINGTDSDLINWLEFEFGKPDNCPICYYRWHEGAECTARHHYKTKCLAIINGEVCYCQDWYNELRNLASYNPNVTRIRKILKTRLKYWKKVYAEKYPGAK